MLVLSLNIALFLNVCSFVDLLSRNQCPFSSGWTQNSQTQFFYAMYQAVCVTRAVYAHVLKPEAHDELEMIFDSCRCSPMFDFTAQFTVKVDDMFLHHLQKVLKRFLPL